MTDALIEDTQAARRDSVLHPVTLEVIRNALPAVSYEMSADFQRASYNMMIYEVRDYCCALVGVDGQLWSQNLGGVSHFVADIGVVIEDAVARYGADGFAPGDVLITNHQAIAGQHLNNMVVHMPVFVGGEVVCFTAVRAHWVDIGGRSTAVLGVADPWMEGLQIDQLKIHHAGVPDDTLMSVIRTNIRYPDASLGDLRSQIAACQLGAQRVQELYGRYGTEVIEAAIARIFADSEMRCRGVVAEIPDGIYEAESFLDNDDVTNEPIRIHARVEIAGGDMTIDLSGCSDQRPGAVNSRTHAAGYVAYKCLTAPEEPVNAGSFRALNVVIPEGNIMMARFPAPMAGWSNIIPTVIDTILLALAPAMPDRIPAAHMGYLGGMLLFQGVDPHTNTPFIAQSIEGGGWGGRPHEDGVSAAVSVCQGEVQNAPIESLELRMPVVIEERALRTDSGGAGRWRGGLGTDTRVRSLVEGRWKLSQTGRTITPPWGLRGGKPTPHPAAHFLKLPDGQWQEVNVAMHQVPAGSRAIIRVAGGGGWGDPFERDPELVLADVRAGYVTAAAAAAEYGVAITAGSPVQLDLAATKLLRSR